MVIMRSFGIAETTSFFRIAAPSFYRLFRQSVVNPFPPPATSEVVSKRWHNLKSGNKARILEFDVERPIQQDGKMTTMSQSVKAPFIGLVPIPSLLIDRVDVDFQMEVTDTSNVKSTTNAEVETKASAKHWFINAEISGKVTTARENTRMTNQTAKYQIHVTASQQPQTEGLSKLMDIMASCIEPINTESSK